MSTLIPERSRHSYGVLAKVKLSELKSIRVAVRRKDIVSSQPLPEGPIIRDLEDPRTIVPLVHIKKGNIPSRQMTIFDREGILVNQTHRVPRSRTSSRSNSTPRNYSKTRTRSRSKSLSQERRYDKYKSRKNDNRGYKDQDRDSLRHRSTERLDRNSPRRRSKDRSLSKRRSTNRSLSRRRSISRRRRISTDRISSRHRSPSIDKRRNDSNKRESAERRSSRISIYRGHSPRRNSRDRSRSPRKKSTDSHRYINKASTSKYTDKESRYSDRSPKRRSYSREKDRYRDRKRSITPLRPGEYRPNHPDLKKNLERDDSDKNNSTFKRRQTSRSPERYRPPRRPEISPSPRSRRRRRSRSRSPRVNEMPHFGDPNVDYRYHEGMPGAEYWMHPGPLRPGYPMPRYYPTFFPRGIPPVGHMMYLPPFPNIPPVIRPRFPIYNNRQKPKITPIEDNANATESVIEKIEENGNEVQQTGVISENVQDKDGNI